MVSRKEIQCRRELPVAPIRHMDVMDKLARCQFCDRLCCCLEHLVEHEDRHLTAKGKLQSINKESKCSSEPSGWVEATEHVLLSRRKIYFPLFCIYCKITVRNEHELRHLTTVGPRCALKECHWMISFQKYMEKSRSRKIALVFEETERNTVDRAVSFGSANFTVNNHLTYPHVTPRENSSRSLGRMKPISTSTPQDGCDPSCTSEKDISSAAVEQTPVGAKTANAPHSILAVRNDQKPKGESARKVTFSCIVETTNNSSIESNNNDQVGNEKEILDNKNDMEKKMEENEDFLAEKLYKQEEKNEKITFKYEDSDMQFLSENDDQNMCNNKLVEVEKRSFLIANEKQIKDIDENLDCLDGLGLICKSNKVVKEELEGEELDDEECKLENDCHERLEVPKNSEVNNEDGPEDKTFENSEKGEIEMLDSHFGEIDSQNSSLNESGELSSQLNFYSEEESRNETNTFENESCSSKDDYFKAFREGNSGSKLHTSPCQSFQDSQNPLSNPLLTGQTFSKTSKLQEQVETNDSTESKPQFIENELQLDEQASGEEDSEVSSHDDGGGGGGGGNDGDDDYDGEGGDEVTNLPCAEGHVPSGEQQSIESNIEEDWGLTKLKTALSYSWGKAKELVMQPWGTKRDNTEQEEGNDENSAKRIKMSHSSTHSYSNPNSSSPVQWKCSQRPVRSTEYFNISKRRPLPRMMKK